MERNGEGSASHPGEQAEELGAVEIILLCGLLGGGAKQGTEQIAETGSAAAKKTAESAMKKKDEVEEEVEEEAADEE